MDKVLDINVIILAGGLGMRIKSLFPNIPKPLIPVQGKPFITYIFDQLINFNIKNVTICIGYNSLKFKAIIGNNYKNLKISYSEEYKPMGTGGALKLIKFEKNKKKCLILNGDSYVNFNLNSLLKKHNERKSKISVVLSKVLNRSRFGSIVINNKNEITSFTEKSISHEKGFINAGVYLFNSEVFDEISNKIPYSLELDFFPKQIGRSLNGFICHGKFIDIGTPISFKKASQNTFWK
tara:strand:- start:959 stop:1669 length:711 start_codon:yes stop_codon:yes gene_type:complete